MPLEFDLRIDVLFSEFVNMEMQGRRVSDEMVNASGASLLLQGIQNILRCDQAEVVSGIARYVMSQHRALSVGSQLMERTRSRILPSVAALLGCATRFLEVRQPIEKEGVIWVARLSNERLATNKAKVTLPDVKWAELKLRRLPDLAAVSALIRLPARRRILNIARMLHRRHAFFRVLRAVELIGYYARYLSLLRLGNYKLAVMSNHSNPHGIAFNLAARRTGIRTALITHGMPLRPVARLQYDVAMVHSEAARLTYAGEGCRFGQVFIQGRRQEHRQMITQTELDGIAIGIFLCKDVNEVVLQKWVEQLLQHPRVWQILIRPHPKNLWLGLEKWVREMDDSRLKQSSGSPVVEDLGLCDIVLAGNSSVLIDAVVSGRPAAYVPNLDYGAPDMHRLVQRRLVYALEDHKPGAQDPPLDFDEMVEFYQRPEWPTVLRFFANVDEDEDAVLARLREAIRTVIET